MSKSVRIAIAIIVSVVILAVIAVAVYYVCSINTENVCDSPECSEAASRILVAMNATADPCNDFYQYACGGWISENPIPANKATYDRYDITAEKNAKVMKDVLSSDPSNDRDAIRKAKLFYQSCINEESIEKLDALPALDLIEQSGGIPLFGNQSDIDKDFKLEKYMAKIAKTFSSSWLIAFLVDADDMNSTRNIIHIDQPPLGMPDRAFYLLDRFNSTQIAYREYLQEFFELIWRKYDEVNGNATFDREALKTAINEIYQLEEDLARIIVPEEDRQSVYDKYNKMQLGEMSTKLSADFEWMAYIREIMSYGGVDVQADTEVVVYGTPYLSQMMSVLKKYDIRVIKNYAVMINIPGTVFFLPKKYRILGATYRKLLMGTDQLDARWKGCLQMVTKGMPMPVGAMFVESTFAESSKGVILQMVDALIESFKESLGQLDWMDSTTKEKAKNKVDVMARQIAYPDYIVDKNNPKLDDDLAEINPTLDNSFETSMDLQREDAKRSIKRLYSPVDRSEWHMCPAESNAYYSPNVNAIAFAAAILQPPAFNVRKPYSMNFGGIGVVIGHEITHGFDTTGADFNEVGNLKNWWTNYSRTHFDEGAECFTKQYGEFFYEDAEMFVNGKLTASENIADNGGLRAAYYAYKLWKKQNPGIEFSLPGLESFTSEQLYFIASAQIWCGKERNEAAMRRILQNNHSPWIFRAEATVSNFEEFGKAFGCLKGVDRLYPNLEDTCRIW